MKHHSGVDRPPGGEPVTLGAAHRSIAVRVCGRRCPHIDAFCSVCNFSLFLSPQRGVQRSVGRQPGTDPPLAGMGPSSSASVNQDAMETDWHRQADSRESVAGGAKRKLNAGLWG